jgi:hypothetical protein
MTDKANTPDEIVDVVNMSGSFLGENLINSRYDRV